MVALLRLALIGFVALSVVYALLSVYSASVRREKLERHWDAAPPPGAGRAERTAFIEDGMRVYRHGLRRKLILLVYVVPVLLACVVVYSLNFN